MYHDVLVIVLWNLRFICYLVLEIWDLIDVRHCMLNFYRLPRIFKPVWLPFAIYCMPNTVLSPLPEYFDRISLKDVDHVFRFAAHQTGKNKAFLGEKSPVYNQAVHDIVVNVRNQKISRICDHVLCPALHDHYPIFQSIQPHIARGELKVKHENKNLGFKRVDSGFG